MVSRAAIVFCGVICALAGFGRLGVAQESTPKPTPTPAACARPNVRASVVHAVRGVVSPMAEQQDLYGRVDVVVSLDADSRIVGARVLRSPSGVLSQAAITAARASSFQTAIVDCRPIASDLIYSVDFPETITYATAPSGARSISILADATVTRAPDVAYVDARIATVDDHAAGAVQKNDAIFEALKAKLRALGVPGRSIQATRSVHGIPSPVPFEAPPPRPSQGYESVRQIEVTIDAVKSAGDVAAAAASVRFVDVAGIRYTLNDDTSAYNEARALALKDAEARARRALTPQRLQLGALLRIDTPPNDRATRPTEFIRLHSGLNGAAPSTLAIPALQVRATATVTYAIGP